MPEPPEPQRLVNAKRFLLGITAGETRDLISLLSRDVVYTVPGHGPLAGVFRGPVEVFQHVGKLFRMTTGTLEVLKWVDWLVGDTHIAALQYAQAQGGGALYRNHQVYVVETNQSDLLTNIRVFFEDQAAADRFFSGLPLD